MDLMSRHLGDLKKKLQWLSTAVTLLALDSMSSKAQVTAESSL